MSNDVPTDPKIADRKLEHLRAIENDPAIERHSSGFDTVSLTHRAFPELDYDEIQTETTFLGKSIRFPLLISSMTGGDGAEIMRINRNLAQAAEECGVAMATGSQRVMFTNPDARQSFDLRPFAPSVPLIGNIGAVQLNYGMGSAQCAEAVEVLGADALYLHLNPLQEVVQPEGDRNFANLAQLIAELAPALQVPVMLKEVGSGLSARDIEIGLSAGINHFDVAGRGGTSWSRIEYHRRSEDCDDLGLQFQDWGLTTVEALHDATEVLARQPQKTTLVASGGVRNGLDMAKSLILGADVCGVAAPFLKAAQSSTSDVVKAIEKFQREFKTAMFLLGSNDIDALKGNSSLIRKKARL